MPPQQTPYQNPNNQLPPQPTAPNQPTTPQYAQPQPVAPMPQPQNFAGQAMPQYQPVVSAPPAAMQYPQVQGQPANLTPQNSSGLAYEDAKKERKLPLLLAIGSLVIFVIGFLVGFAAIAGALLGSLAVRKSKPIHYTLGFVLGLIGLILNAGLYLIAVLAK